MEIKYSKSTNSKQGVRDMFQQYNLYTMITIMAQENEEQCIPLLPTWRRLALEFVRVEEDD